jgi:hypothetical protein
MHAEGEDLVSKDAHFAGEGGSGRMRLARFSSSLSSSGMYSYMSLQQEADKVINSPSMMLPRL